MPSSVNVQLTPPADGLQYSRQTIQKPLYIKKKNKKTAFKFNVWIKSKSFSLSEFTFNLDVAVRYRWLFLWCYLMLITRGTFPEYFRAVILVWWWLCIWPCDSSKQNSAGGERQYPCLTSSQNKFKLCVMQTSAGVPFKHVFLRERLHGAVAQHGFSHERWKLG